MKYITLRYGHEQEKTAEIMEMVQEAQKRCSARTISGYWAIGWALERIEKYCPIKTKGKRTGLQFCIDPHGQTFPKAYKYTPESTLIYGTYTKNGMRIWFGRDTTKKDQLPEFYSFNEEQILYVLQAAGVDTHKTEKAFNYYKNGTKCVING